MFSVNKNAGALFDQMVERSDELRIQTHPIDGGGTLIDAGCHCIGSVDAGLMIARICMGGLSDVSVTSNTDDTAWPTSVSVSTSQPLLACLGCQYAGWNLSVNNEDKTYRAMASGPGRIVCAKEGLIDELGFSDSSGQAVFVLESDQLPPHAIFDKIAKDCDLPKDRINLVVTPTGSLAGTTQIACRVVEVALHQAHELKFPVDKIVQGFGTTPLSPPIDDFMTAMGRTNDSILYGGRVHLIVDADPAQAKALAENLPSCTSKDYGKPFGDVFKHYKYDFFAVDPGLFSPALVSVTTLASGQTFSAGKLNTPLLHQSFGIA